MSIPLLAIKINCLRIGKIEKFGPNEELSGIKKKAINAPLYLKKLGFIGDEQADKRVHGGLEKAIHHFPAEHYDVLKSIYPQAVFEMGGFGENISTTGIIENQVCFGDVFKLGNAIIELSQGRQPCWKLSHRFQIFDLAKTVQYRCLTGWYYRVIKEGEVSQGDPLMLIDRPYKEANLAEVMNILLRDRMNMKKINVLLSLPVLPDRWRKILIKRITTGKIEDESQRIQIPVVNKR